MPNFENYKQKGKSGQNAIPLIGEPWRKELYSNTGHLAMFEIRLLALDTPLTRIFKRTQVF